MPRNRFAGLIEARHPAAATTAASTSPPRDQELGTAGVTRGRPRTGKRSNPDYKQISALIRKDTHRGVARALLDEDASRDVSDLLQELLEGWLERR